MLSDLHILIGCTQEGNILPVVISVKEVGVTGWNSIFNCMYIVPYIFIELIVFESIKCQNQLCSLCFIPPA